MKKVVFCMLMLFCVADFANAAFLVKSKSATLATVASNTGTQATNAIVAHTHTNFITRMKNRVLSALMQLDEGWGRGGEGSRAMFWAAWGIFIWPLGILAIIHGVNGLHSRNGLEQDRATLGLIFGVGETILTVAAIIWFFAFFLI